MNDQRIKPFADILRVAKKEISRAEWKEPWEMLGLLELDLGTLRA